MRALAKLGFSQSYTYFTWKNSRLELEEYVGELAPRRCTTSARTSSSTRPTSSSAYLQEGGPPAFAARLVLAATLSPAYGVYSGFENYETSRCEPDRGVPRFGEVRDQAARAGRTAAAADRAASTRSAVGMTALQRVRQRRLPARRERRADRLREGAARTNADRGRQSRPRGGAGRDRDNPAARLGLPPVVEVRDLLGGERFSWRLGRNFVRLDPAERAARHPSCRGCGVRRRPDSGSSPARCGSRRRCSMRSTCAASSTATATARRLPRPDREARLSRLAGDRLHLAAADVCLAAGRRGLRHLRLQRRAPRLRHDRRRPHVRRSGAPAGHPRDRRTRHQSHLGPAPVVPAAARPPDSPKRNWYVWSDDPTRYAEARIIFTDAEISNWTWDRAGRRLLLASLLPPPAGSQLRQARGPAGDARRGPLLARYRPRRLPPRRRPLPLRARRHELREPAGDARLLKAPAGDRRRRVSGSSPARGGEPVAAGRRRVLRRRRRVPDGVPLPR